MISYSELTGWVESHDTTLYFNNFSKISLLIFKLYKYVPQYVLVFKKYNLCQLVTFWSRYGDRQKGNTKLLRLIPNCLKF